MYETNDQIIAAPCPKCILCGNQGSPLYEGLQDRLFDAPGLWSLKICPQNDCGLVWPDPMPLDTEIWKAYRNYYTHSGDSSDRNSSLKQLYVRTKRRLLSSKFGYPQDPADQRATLLGRVCQVLPMMQQLALEHVRFLPFVLGGKLLDVGCGSGGWLAQMKGLGWTVEGVDFDPKAVQAACDMGISVHLGSVEDQSYPAASFDAIMLNHVIEHVPDPISTINECARLLKPGGRLVMFTPNAASFSHRFFKQDWRGLEPPRHLHIFSFKSMRKLFDHAQFASVSIGPDIGTSASFESMLIRRARQGRSKVILEGWRRRPFWRLVSFIQHLTVWAFPAVAECQVVVALQK